MAEEGEVNRENREEKEITENKGVDEGTKWQEVRRLKIVGHLLKRNCFPSQRSVSQRPERILHPAGPFLSIFCDLLARIMKARILPPIVSDSTMLDVVYFFYKA